MQQSTPDGLPRPGSVLHVGCGGNVLPAWLATDREVRLDINPDCHPDIVASMTDLGEIGLFDAVYCCHALEHLAPHEVGVALREFHRVLSPGGFAFVLVPDLEDVRPTEDVLYVSNAGPITGLDMFYGYRRCLAEQPHMAHRTGFVAETLRAAMSASGFSPVITHRCSDYNLAGVGVKA